MIVLPVQRIQVTFRNSKFSSSYCTSTISGSQKGSRSYGVHDLQDQFFVHDTLHCGSSVKTPLRVAECNWPIGLAADLNKLWRVDGNTGILHSVDASYRQENATFREIIFKHLQICSKIKDLEGGRCIHLLVVGSGLDADAFLGDHFIRILASFECLLEANLVFCRITSPSIYTWNAIISAHCSVGNDESALGLYSKMKEDGAFPDKITFLCLLKACSNIGTLVEGRLIHIDIILACLLSDVAIGSTIVDMYAKCGSLEDAESVFQELQDRNNVSWNVMIAGYAEHGHDILVLELYNQMQQMGIQPDKVTLLHTVRACCNSSSLSKGRFLHDHSIRMRLELDVVVGSALIDMYAKSGSLEEAQNLFDRLPNRDLVAWSAMIVGYAHHELEVPVMDLFEKMLLSGLKPDKVTFSSVVSACGRMCAIDQGRLIHDQIIRRGMLPDVVVESAILDMYSKCGSLDEARRVFDKLVHKNCVSWGAMLSGYVEHGNTTMATELFWRMQHEQVEPSIPMLLCVLKACSTTRVVEQGRLVHALITDSGLNSDAVIGSTLVDMYAKCGSVEDACGVFRKLPNRDVVLWGSIITGSAQQGHFHQAFQLFVEMQTEGIKPSASIYLSVLNACSELKTVSTAKKIYHQLLEDECEADVSVGSTLVDAYVKCGVLEDAQHVFSRLSSRDTVSWGAIIGGYTQHGHDGVALEMFEKMQQEGIEPSSATVLCVLKVCGNAGALKTGREMHNQLVTDGLQLDPVFVSTLVEMYAQCGSLNEARKAFDSLPTQNVVTWGALIAGYAWSGDFKAVWCCLEEMHQKGLKPVEAIFTSILAACSHAGQLVEGCRCIKSMRDDHGITPNVEHMHCLIDLLSRAGCLIEAEDVMLSMPSVPGAVAWMSLLSASRTYGDVKLGHECYDEIVKLDPADTSGHTTLMSVFADAQMWDALDSLQNLDDHSSAPKKPGRAWIELDSTVHVFIVGERTHPQNNQINSKLMLLANLMREDGYWPNVDLILRLGREL